MLGLTIFTIALGAFATWLLLYFLIPQLRRKVLDQPNIRSSHCKPTPSGGGLSFVLVASSTSALVLLVGNVFSLVPLGLISAPLLALPLAILGFIDDRYNIPASWRYAVQLLTALVVILTSELWITSFDLLLALPLLVVAVTAIINFTNFMDGLDGLVAGCMAVVITAAAVEMAAPLSAWVLVGGLLGFLLWNWSPAKVFMGDVGSTFLGAVFSVLVLQESNWPEALALLLVATPLLGDAFLCVLRRLLTGQRVFQAHRLHLFQRLYQAGWPHARVSSLYIAATAVLAIALLCGGLPWVITLAAAELLIGIWLDQQVAFPYAEACLH